MIAEPKNSVKAGSLDSSVEIHEFIREYKKTRWSPNSERIGKPDSLSVWFSIEEIEQFLVLAKSKSGDGIRFYFAAYPETYLTKPEFAGRQTLVLVGTRSKITEHGEVSHKDIYHLENGRLKILSGDGPNILCPPKCNPPSEGGMGDLGITLIDKGDKGMEII